MFLFSYKIVLPLYCLCIVWMVMYRPINLVPLSPLAATRFIEL